MIDWRLDVQTYLRDKLVCHLNAQSFEGHCLQNVIGATERRDDIDPIKKKKNSEMSGIKGKNCKQIH